MAPEHSRVEVPLEVEPVRVMLVGEALHARPFDGEIDVDSETAPIRP